MIRKAYAEDLAQIVALIEPYINDFVINHDGREKFSKIAILNLIVQPNVHYFVYQESNQILAVIAYRIPTHLVHFFVDQHRQGQGIGRKLWSHIEALIQSSGQNLVTVNSSCFAENIYKNLGFESVSETLEVHGLRFIQMQKHLA